MAKRTVRVTIPRRRPDKLIQLAEGIVVKHNSFPVGTSPLENLDMNGFETQLDSAKTKRTDSHEHRQTSEGLMQDSDIALGVEQGQTGYTTGTVYYYLLQVRDQLMVVHSGNEEWLSEYGFNVVVSGAKGKRTVKVGLPVKTADKLLQLGGDVKKKHDALGVASPLNSLNMTDFAAKLQTAIDKRASSRNYRQTSEGLMETSDLILGIDKGQGAHTPDTIYNRITKIRDQLLVTYRGNEELLSEFGFNVVVSSYLPGGEDQIIKATVVLTTEKNLDLGMSGNAGKSVEINTGDGHVETMTFNGQQATFINYVYAAIGIYLLQIIGRLLNVIEFHCNGSHLTDLILPDDARNINTLILQNNNLPTAVVDYILIRMNGFNTGGKVINLIGNASPSALGLAAKAALEARGWVVLVS